MNTEKKSRFTKLITSWAYRFISIILGVISAVFSLVLVDEVLAIKPKLFEQNFIIKILENYGKAFDVYTNTWYLILAIASVLLIFSIIQLIRHAVANKRLKKNPEAKKPKFVFGLLWFAVSLVVVCAVGAVLYFTGVIKFEAWFLENIGIALAVFVGVLALVMLLIFIFTAIFYGILKAVEKPTVAKEEKVEEKVEEIKEEPVEEIVEVVEEKVEEPIEQVEEANEKPEEEEEVFIHRVIIVQPVIDAPVAEKEEDDGEFDNVYYPTEEEILAEDEEEIEEEIVASEVEEIPEEVVEEETVEEEEEVAEEPVNENDLNGNDIPDFLETGDPRLRQSFEARLIMAEDNIKEYYTTIKNTLLSYKKTRSRVGWSYDSFNNGRESVAKVNVRGKSLVVYLALTPSDYENTKYFFTDVSDKKKYEKVPMMVKVKSNRGCKYAIELIADVMNKIGAVQGEIPTENYYVEKQTKEELIEKGLIK